MVDILGRLLLLLGAFVPLTAVPLAIVLLVAIFTVHLPSEFRSIKLQSYEARIAHFRQPGMKQMSRTWRSSLHPLSAVQDRFIGSLSARAPAMTRNALSSIAKCTLQTTPYQQDD